MSKRSRAGAATTYTPAYTRTYANDTVAKRYKKKKYYAVKRGGSRRKYIRGLLTLRPASLRSGRLSGFAVRPPAVRLASKNAMLPYMKPCTRKWMDSLLDPFGGPADACNPLTPPVFSERLRTFARVTVTSGMFNAAGNFAAVVFPTPANDTGCLFTSTTAAYAADATAFATACPTANVSNSQFGNINFSGALSQFAIVSYGLRIRYIGKADIMMGQYVLIESPGHYDIKTATSSPQSVLALDQCRFLPISYDWTTIIWGGPQHPAECCFASSSSASGNVVGTNVPSVLTLLIRGVTDANAQTFQMELFMNHEIIGTGSRGQQYSEQDLAGGNDVVAGLLRVLGNKALNVASNSEQVRTFVKQKLTDAIHEIGGGGKHLVLCCSS